MLPNPSSFYAIVSKIYRLRAFILFSFEHFYQFVPRSTSFGWLKQQKKIVQRKTAKMVKLKTNLLIGRDPRTKLIGPDSGLQNHIIHYESSAAIKTKRTVYPWSQVHRWDQFSVKMRQFQITLGLFYDVTTQTLALPNCKQLLKKFTMNKMWLNRN